MSKGKGCNVGDRSKLTLRVRLARVVQECTRHQVDIVSDEKLKVTLLELETMY